MPKLTEVELAALDLIIAAKKKDPKFINVGQIVNYVDVLVQAATVVGAENVPANAGLDYIKEKLSGKDYTLSDLLKVRTELINGN